MKRTALALTLILALLISIIALAHIVGEVDANPLPPSYFNPKMTVNIDSPLKGTYNALPVCVNFTATSSEHFSLGTETIKTFDNQTEDWIRAFFYILDGQNMRYSGVKFDETQMTEVSLDRKHHFNGQTYLTNLADGVHSITVYYGVLVNVGSSNELILYDSKWSATSQFYIGTEPAHSPSPTSAPSISPSVEPPSTPTPPNIGPTSPPSPELMLTRE